MAFMDGFAGKSFALVPIFFNSGIYRQYYQQLAFGRHLYFG
jgi:hypothetical protein